MHRQILFTFLLAACSTLPAAALDYEKDVMPIFRAKCYDCHSEKAEKVKGGLRLDDPEGFLKRFAKNDVVIPGDWDASYLFVTITKPRGAKHAMPPEDGGDPLTPEEIMIVAKWIHEGAPIGREKGEKGTPEMAPEKILRFKDGTLVLEEEADPDAPTTEPSPVHPAAATESPQEWTNQAGQKIIATFKGIKDGKAHFLLETGRTILYPLDRLSEESQAKIRKLAEAK